MTELVTHDRSVKRGNGAKRQPKRDRDRMVVDDVVTPNSLATHLGCTRQNIARLTAEAVIEQRSDGCYDQSASRLRYIKHLRTPRSSRSEAEAAHVRAKAEMLQIKIMQQQRKLVLREDVNELLDAICGVVLTHLSGLPARCSRDGPSRNRAHGVRGAHRIGASLRKDGRRTRRAAA